MPLPSRIANAPELDIGLELFYVAFFDLHSCRQIGFSAGPIPWTAIRDYANEHNIFGDQREDLFYYVQMMDKAYLEWQSKEADRKSK